MDLLLFLVLIVLLLGAVGSYPSWPYASGWGYYPSGLAGLLVVILLLMFLFGAFAWPWAPVAPV